MVSRAECGRSTRKAPPSDEDGDRCVLARTWGPVRSRSYVASLHVFACLQRGPDAAQGGLVVAVVGSHGDGDGQRLLGRLDVARPPQRQPEAEIGVVLCRVVLDDPLETAGRLRVPAGVELGPRQRLPDTA